MKTIYVVHVEGHTRKDDEEHIAGAFVNYKDAKKCLELNKEAMRKQFLGFADNTEVTEKERSFLIEDADCPDYNGCVYIEEINVYTTINTDIHVREVEIFN